MQDPTSDGFRAVMSRFPTGVTIMTTLHDGEPHGMTVNALASVSLEPLLALVSVERGTVMERFVTSSGIFALSFLPAEGARASVRFADHERPRGQAQFEGFELRDGVTGAPLLAEALAWLECRVWKTYDGGDHVLVVGEVVGLDVGPDAPALVYFRSGYGRLDRSDVEPPPVP